MKKSIILLIISIVALCIPVQAQHLKFMTKKQAIYFQLVLESLMVFLLVKRLKFMSIMTLHPKLFIVRKPL